LAKATVRLKDIADKTGFSTNTVSLALRESPRIPPETRSIIRNAAVELNYFPNHIAKALVSRSTMTIGLVLTEITNPILTETAQAIELALAERGYGTLFATSNNNYADEVRAVELFRSRRVDGILIYPTSPRRLDHIRPLRANMPVVMLTGDPDGTLDAVCIDDKRGAYKATRHLIEMGHRRVGIIDGGTRRGNTDKLDGYHQALAESGIAVDARIQVEPSENSLMGGYWAMDPLMHAPDRPTAVFAVTDSLAIGALRWCLKHGLRVPEDVAIIGCDNIDFAEYASVPLSSVNYAVEVVCRLAVDRLMRLIAAGDQLPEPRATLIDPELVIRESSGGALPR
jgi:LacI family transcriptional regulator